MLNKLMKHGKNFFVLIGFSIVALIFSVLYLYNFHEGLSDSSEEWDAFGSYFAGSIGVCFSLLGVYLLYLTFKEERKIRIEEMFQQYISNYYSLLNLIKENWLHKEKTAYNNGREIFGNAVRVIKIDNLEAEIQNEKNKGATCKWVFDHQQHISNIKSETINNEKESFKRGFLYIYGVHVNVFFHYCNSLIVFFDRTFKNNDIDEKEKEDYINRLLSTLSLFELIFFSYFIVYIYKGEYQTEIREKILNNIPDVKSFKYLQESHNSQVNSIVEILKGE